MGAREFASKLHINAYEAAGGSPIAIADNNGSIKDENGEELLKATVGNGATLVAGSLIKIADSDGDGKVRGSDITVDLNGDDIPDLLPSSDILASGIIDLSVVTQASADPLAATVVDVDLANPVIANRYRKFFNNQWNDFVYDPLRPELGGAELLDANGDGLIEKVRLHLFDGGAGDNDGVVNGVIVDPGLLVIDETSQPIPPEPEPASLAVHRLFNPDSSRHLFFSR